MLTHFHTLINGYVLIVRVKKAIVLVILIQLQKDYISENGVA